MKTLKLTIAALPVIAAMSILPSQANAIARDELNYCVTDCIGDYATCQQKLKEVCKSKKKESKKNCTGGVGWKLKKDEPTIYVDCADDGDIGRTAPAIAANATAKSANSDLINLIGFEFK